MGGKGTTYPVIAMLPLVSAPLPLSDHAPADRDHSPVELGASTASPSENYIKIEPLFARLAS